MRQRFKWILFVAIILLGSFFLQNSFQRQGFERNKKVQSFVGKTFNSPRLIDTNNQVAQIEFSSHDYTIIDFWFSECPGCLTEMKKFDALLNSKGRSLKIVSISINSHPHWKSLFSSEREPYSFLKISNPSWHHFALQSQEDPNLGNNIPMDNYAFMLEQYKGSDYPMYFVVNRKGEIIEVPTSAVDYIEATF